MSVRRTRRAPNRAPILLLAVVVLFLPASGGAQPWFLDDLVETVTIPVGDFVAVGLGLAGNELFAFRMRVLSGSEIDVYFVNEGDYTRYRLEEPEFFYYVPASRERTRDFVGRMNMPATGNYYIILDNQVWTATGASPMDIVTAEITGTKEFLPGVGIGVVAILVGVASGVLTFVALVIHHRSRCRRASAPPR